MESYPHWARYFAEQIVLKRPQSNYGSFVSVMSGVNAKGDNLISALTQGFERIEKLGGQCKAVIFTEFQRT